MRWLKQSTSVDVPIGPFMDETDGITAMTGLTITQPDIRLKKNGGAWAQKNASQTLSHEENGNYEVTLDATDTNTLGLLRVHVHESGALPVWDDFLVLPAPVYDGLVAGTTTQPTGVPSTTADPMSILAWLLALSANTLVQTDSLQTLRNRADNADIAEAVIEINSGVDTRRESYT